MQTMRVAVLRAPRQVEIEERPKPQPGRGEVLVRTKACALCSLERRLYTGAQVIMYPLVGGHEVSGIVEELGEGVLTPFEVGEHVVLDLLNRCGECWYCRTGHSNHCVNMWRKENHILGGLAEYISVPSKQVFAIDRNVSFPEAALTEPLSDCIHSLMRTHLSPEMKVLVIGAGTMGLLHLAVLKHYGMTALVSDMEDDKLQVAASMGADYVFDRNDSTLEHHLKEAGIGGADVVIVTAPGEQAIGESFRAVGPQGVIVLFASQPEGTNICVDANLVHYKEVTITGSESRTEKDFLQAVAMQNSRDLYLAPLVSQVMPLEDIALAFETSLDVSKFRIVVAMDGLDSF